MRQKLSQISECKSEKLEMLVKKKGISSIKYSEIKSIRSKNSDEDDTQDESYGLTIITNQKTKKVLNKINKKQFKKIQWTITPIYDSLSFKKMLYCTGEILIDFDKRDSAINKRSPWNDVKNISNIESDYKNEIIIINFDQQTINFIECKKQMNSCLRQPDQYLHQFGQTLLEFEEIYTQYQNFVKININNIKKNENNMMEFINRKEQFNKMTRKYYKQLNDEEKFFFSFESFPNLVNNQYIAQKMILGRQLCNLLGTNQQSLLHILTRNGIIDFYDFETTLIINKRIIDSIVSHFKDKTVDFENFKNFKDIDDNSFCKFFTLDDIEFFTHIRIEYLTLDSLLGTPPDQYKNDFYATVIILEPTQNTLNSIQGVRATQKWYTQQLIKELESDIAYTVQSECFIKNLEKFMQQNTDQKETLIKVCGIKEIDSNDSSERSDQY